jgi:hypothetical protein
MNLMKNYPKQDEQPGAGGGGSAAPAAASTPAPSPAASQEGGAPTGAPVVNSSALSAGDAPKPLAEAIPEKYRVVGADGKFDQDASTRKMLEGHSALEKRMGAGDAPPKTPEDYKIEGLPEHINIEELKKDEKYNGFLKAAHGRGLTNAQVSFVLNEYMSRADDVAGVQTAESANAELRKVWADDQSFDANRKAAFRAATTVAQRAGLSIEAVNEALGNNPVAIRLLAAMGAEMKEDNPPNDTTQASEMDVNSLMKSKAYWDAKDPEHEKVKAKVSAHFVSKFSKK